MILRCRHGPIVIIISSLQRLVADANGVCQISIEETIKTSIAGRSGSYGQIGWSKDRVKPWQAVAAQLTLC